MAAVDTMTQWAAGSSTTSVTTPLTLPRLSHMTTCKGHPAWWTKGRCHNRGNTTYCAMVVSVVQVCRAREQCLAAINTLSQSLQRKSLPDDDGPPSVEEPVYATVQAALRMPSCYAKCYATEQSGDTNSRPEASVRSFILHPSYLTRCTDLSSKYAHLAQ